MAVNEELLAFAADLANELERHEGRERARSKKDKARFTNAVYCLLHKAMHSFVNSLKWSTQWPTTPPMANAWGRCWGVTRMGVGE